MCREDSGMSAKMCPRTLMSLTSLQSHQAMKGLDETVQLALKGPFNQRAKCPVSGVHDSVLLP